LIAIVFSEGPLAGERIELDRDVTIGREDCDVTPNDHQVSRRHLALKPVGDDLHVEDLGSSNGTFVNGHRISESVSAGDGDVIRLGTSEAIVQVTKPRDPSLPAVPVPATPTGGLPGGFWIATGVVEIGLILTAATLLVYYALR
jgi:pSer/pThr/pTyr-binding forkhead associated (FHA) protein